MKYIVVIPARYKSSRLEGKPLISWTIDACLNSKKIEEVIISTDSLEYWRIIRSLHASKKINLDHRQKEDAADTKKVFDYVKENPPKRIQQIREIRYGWELVYSGVVAIGM